MFEHLDVALAFAAIMLMLSLLVTASVQLLISIFGIRGRNLKWAVTEVLQRCDPDLGPEDSARLTAALLRDPLLSTSTNRVLWLVDMVLVRLRRDATKPSLNYGKRPPVRLDARTIQLAVRRLSDANWHDREGDLSDNARLQTLVNRLLGEHRGEETKKETVGNGASSIDESGGNGPSEGSDPETRDRERATSKLAAGLTDWFDVAMAASSERFKLWARWLTAAGALAIGLGLQVDAPEIWRRLSTDGDLRSAAIANIAALDSIYGVSANPTGQTTESTPPTAEVVEQQVDRLRSMGDDLEEAGVLTLSVPRTRAEFVDSIGGKLVTTLLLSLGAPFWYGVLAGLVGFKGSKTEGRTPLASETNGTGS